MCVFSQKGPEYMVDDRAIDSLHLSKLRPEESTSRAINFSQYTQWIGGSAVMIPVLFLMSSSNNTYPLTPFHFHVHFHVHFVETV